LFKCVLSSVTLVTTELIKKEKIMTLVRMQKLKRSESGVGVESNK
jgi:hypothetical protein